MPSSDQFSSVAQSCPTLCNPMNCSTQASLSITNYRSLLKLMSVQLVMHPTISSSVIPFFSCLQSFPVSGSFLRSVLCIRWPKYWSFSFSISPSNEYSGFFPLGWTGWISLWSKGLSKSLFQHHSSKASILGHSAFSMVQLPHPYMTTGKIIALTR